MSLGVKGALVISTKITSKRLHPWAYPCMLMVLDRDLHIYIFTYLHIRLLDYCITYVGKDIYKEHFLWYRIERSRPMQTKQKYCGFKIHFQSHLYYRAHSSLAFE